MIVEKIRILSFKTIVSEQELDVDPKITVLIGGNETGKTNILQAISKFWPSNNFDTEDISQSSTHYRGEILPHVGVIFSISQEEQGKLSAILPIFQDSNRLELWKRGNGLDAYHMQVSKEQSGELSRRNGDLQKQINALNKEIQDANERLESIKKKVNLERKDLAHLPAEKKEEAEKNLERLTSQSSEITASIEEMRVKLEKFSQESLKISNVVRRLKNNYLNLNSEETLNIFQVLPNVYFPQEISYLPEKVSISDLISHPISDKNKVVANLLKLGDIDDLRRLQAPERRRAVALREAERLISERLSKIWKQEEIEFEIDADERFIKITLREPVSISSSPEERSNGFKWFLSFYIQFIVDAKEQLKNTLILLDDPAIHLHPNGQKDFLAILEEISGNNQIVYTTHSPFLINKNFPGRIRLLTKNEKGTAVNNKPYAGKKSKFWEPLRTAIGVCLGDSLFLNQKNVITEGVSDQIMLVGFNQKFAATEKPCLDLEKVAIVPGMGADTVVHVAILACEEGLEGLIILDSDKKGDSIAAKIEKRIPELKKKMPIIRVDNFKKEAVTLEDLVPLDDYLKAVNSAYSKTIEGFKEINEKDVTGKSEPKDDSTKSSQREAKKIGVVQSIFDIFEKHDYGDFDKVLVAKELTNIIQPNDLMNDKYNHLSKLFSDVREYLKLE